MIFIVIFSLNHLLQEGFLIIYKTKIHAKNMIKFNKYINKLEIIEKDYKIENDTYLSK